MKSSYSLEDNVLILKSRNIVSVVPRITVVLAWTLKFDFNNAQTLVWGKMAPISIKIVLDDGTVTRKVKFDSTITVAKAHEIVKEKFTALDASKAYGLFLRSADNDVSGVWLDHNRNLDYYMLRNGDQLDYLPMERLLKVKILDGTIKTLRLDQSKKVGELMRVICGRIGITNHDEYGLCWMNDDKTDDKSRPTGTLTAKTFQSGRDAEFEELSKKLHTDDNVRWLDQHKTLRELALDETTPFLLKRKLYYSDRNVDERDPMQLNLLYLQTRDAILNLTHTVTEKQAVDCKIRWINIRDVHRRLWRKRLADPERKFKAYKYENQMSFMKAFYKDVVAPDNVEVEYEEKDFEEWNNESGHEQQEVNSDSSDEPIKKVPRRRKSNKKQDKSSDDDKPLASTFSDPNVTPELDPADPVDAFLISIASTLKTFSPYHLNLAKSKIFSVVQEHDLEQIMQKQSKDVKVSSPDSMFLNE